MRVREDRALGPEYQVVGDLIWITFLPVFQMIRHAFCSIFLSIELTNERSIRLTSAYKQN